MSGRANGHASSPPPRPPLDMGTAGGLPAGNGEPDAGAIGAELRALSCAYVATLTRQLGELRELLAQLSECKDDSLLRAAERLAHRIAGTAGTFGHHQVSALAQDIESVLGLSVTPQGSQKLAAAVERLKTLCELLANEA
ncbi:MAG: Hpt domain-containing protein [Polyangiaceae bacterium]|nr:Hpt domain-containing protein [Polyangiaceae bacterium]